MGQFCPSPVLILRALPGVRRRQISGRAEAGMMFSLGGQISEHGKGPLSVALGVSGGHGEEQPGPSPPHQADSPGKTLNLLEPRLPRP